MSSFEDMIWFTFWTTLISTVRAPEDCDFTQGLNVSSISTCHSHTLTAHYTPSDIHISPVTCLWCSLTIVQGEILKERWKLIMNIFKNLLSLLITLPETFTFIPSIVSDAAIVQGEILKEKLKLKNNPISLSWSVISLYKGSSSYFISQWGSVLKCWSKYNLVLSLSA